MGRHLKRHSIPTTFVAGIPIRTLRENLHMVDFMRDGKRTRKSYSTLDEAKAYAKIKAAELKQQGTAALAISDALRIEVCNVLKKLNGRITLIDLADYWLARNPDTTAERWMETCERYLSEMRVMNRRKSSVSDKAIKLKILADGMGNPPTCSVDKKTLEDAAKTLGAERDWSASTCDMYVAAGLTLVRFYNGQNKRIRTVDEQPPKTWTADFIADILHKAEEKTAAIVPALAIQIFAGVRPNEIMRLTWDSVNLAERSISLIGATTKTRTTRHVEITSNLYAWLTAYKAEGKIVSSFTTYRRGRQKLKTAMMLTEWPNDVLRHTAATQIYAKTKDVKKTCDELGHFSTAMFLRHYKGIAPKPEDVEKFWAIVPTVAKADLVCQTEPQQPVQKKGAADLSATPE